MPGIKVSVLIEAPPSEVWQVVEDVGSHVDWMDDAVAIRFTSDRTQGVGTTFECDTKVGPFKLMDLMEITQWKPRKAMGVRHVGLVTGEGLFTLKKVRGGRTKFTWKEKLDFPWWLGGPLGELVGGQLVLRRIWKHNLESLKAIVEG